MYKLKPTPVGERLYLYADPLRDRHTKESQLPRWGGTVVGIDVAIERKELFAELMKLIRDAFSVDDSSRASTVKKSAAAKHDQFDRNNSRHVVYFSRSGDRDAAGVYGILDWRSDNKWHFIDVGESEQAKIRVEGHDRKPCWERHRQGTLGGAVLYTRGWTPQQRPCPGRQDPRGLQPAMRSTVSRTFPQPAPNSLPARRSRSASSPTTSRTPTRSSTARSSTRMAASCRACR